MDYIWVVVAFGCGFLVKQINLPPLVGYLAAGFGLHAFGVRPDTDEKEKLLASGIDVVFDFYAEAGAGFADQSIHLIKS